MIRRWKTWSVMYLTRSLKAFCTLKHRPFFVWPVLLWILLSVGFFACGGAGKPESEPRAEYPLPEDPALLSIEGRQGGVLRCPMAGEPRTFNYLAASDSRSKLLSYLTTGTLLEYGPVSLEVGSGICRSHEISDDGLVARLELRRGVRFSDGVPFTADDVVFTFEKIYEEGSANVVRDSVLIGGEPLQVRKLGEYEVEIRFPEPFAAAEYVLSTIPILPKHLLEADGRPIEERWTLDTPPAEMAGLGPFMVQSHVPGRRTVLGYNPHYWKVDSVGNRLPYLDRISIEYTQDRSVHLLRFKAGELDLLDQLLRPEDFRGLADHPGIERKDLGPSSNLAFFWFNLGSGENPSDGQAYLEAHKREWFSNRNFRAAVSAAVSRRSIVRNVFLGKATEAFSFIPVSNRRWYLPQLAGADGDLVTARSLLQRGGFGWNGEGTLIDSKGRPVEFRILAPSSDVTSKTVAILQQDLESLGMIVKVQQEEFRSAISRIMKSRDYDAALMNLDFPFEPTDISNVLLSSGGLHFWNPAQASPASAWEKRIDELVREQGRTLDPDARLELVSEIQEILADQRPFIPLVNRNVLAAWRSGLENVRPANSFPFAMWNSWELYWAAN